MGIFDFVKSAGETLFGKKSTGAEIANAEAEDRQREKILADRIMALDLGVEDLRIIVDDDKAVIGGSVPNQESREKIVLVTGNIEGIALVDDRLKIVVQAEEEAPEPEAVMYTVKSGDSLSRIAKEHYGDAMKYMAIFEANKPMLEDPNKIYPGQVLRIPPLAE